MNSSPKPLPFSGFFIGFLVLLVGAASLGFTYYQASRAHNADRAEILRTAANTGQFLVSAELHSRELTPEFEQTAEYAAATLILRQFQTANRFAYVYTCIQRGDNIYFVLDPTPAGERKINGVDAKSHVMQLYDAPAPELIQALTTGNTVFTVKPYTDDWGTFMSAYAPIKDANNKVVGVFGVDLTAVEYLNTQSSFRDVFLLSLAVIFLSGVISSFCVQYLRKKISLAIKQQQETESNLKFHMNRFRLLVDLIPLPAMFVEGNKLTPNTRLKELLNFEADKELALQDWFPILNPDNPQQANMDYVVNKANKFEGIPRYKIKCKNDTRHFDWICYSSEDVTPAQEVWLLFDVTDRYVNEIKFARLFEVFQEPLILCDDKFNIQDCNPALTELLRTKRNTVINTNLDQFCMSETISVRIAKPLLTQDACKFTTNLLLPYKGKYESCEITATKLFTGSYLIAWHDLTEQTKHINTLKSAQEDALASAKAKSEFLATISHEIRTPMNGVIGTADLLGDTQLTPLQKEFVQTIKGSGGQLIHLINEILDFSKIEAGKLDLNLQPCQLLFLIERSIHTYSGNAIEKNLQLSLNIDPSFPALITTDELRVQQILSNLLNNAVKFTPSGSIKVHLESNDTHVLFSITDTGIGITPQDLPRLFQPFSQADQSTTRKYGGTGLGLAIGQKLAHLLEGFITVRSHPGKGSTFTLYLPKKDCIQHQRLMAKSLPKTRILTSSEDTLSHLSWLYANEESELLRITNPAELTTFPSLVDATVAAQLPEDLKRQVLVLGGKPGAYPHQLSVPFSTQLLLQHLNPSLQTVPSNLSKEHPHKFLLVEDNSVNMRVLTRTLEQLGYTNIITAENGAIALEKMNPSITFVFMDMQMPVMNGLEATKELRAMGFETWICALTANAYSENKEACLESGMNDFVAKPLTKQTLSQAILRGSTRKS